MAALLAPALRVLGRLTGLRAWHFVAGALALALSLAALVAPFWLFAEAVGPTLGVFGVVLALIGYGIAAAALITAGAYVAGRTVLGRLRRLVVVQRIVTLR